jgi:hypothetical protein
MIIVLPDSVVNTNINRLTNQMWKLIPMRENEENWLAQLDTILLELSGLNGLSENTSEQLLILLSKLQGLKEYEVEFQIYRKTVFECISLLREMRL